MMHAVVRPRAEAPRPVQRVLVVHNRYRRGAPAGEDNAFDQEVDMLRNAGLDVETYVRSNDEVRESDVLAAAATAFGMTHSERTALDLRALIAQFRPEVVHFHNTFPLITASGYLACRDGGVPVVQTLHNYRILCAESTSFRAGAPCTLCTPSSHFNAIRHGCYRSHVGSFFVARMLKKQWRSGVFTTQVDRYIALTEFAAQRFAAAGIPRERISVKPNFTRYVPEPGDGSGGYVLFAGKLQPQKGLGTLLRAWSRLAHIPLRIVGTGPLDGELRTRAAEQGLRVEFLGMRPRPDTMELMRRAAFMVLPSECYEGFPLVVTEAYACGTPIVASRIGGLPEMVRDGVTGALFEPGNATALAESVEALWGRRAVLAPMRRVCRAVFEDELCESRNLETLLEVYARATARSQPTNADIAPCSVS
jgi:glycosyltransferase involved in cell wall biosynthesis